MSAEDAEDRDDDSDVAEGLSGFQNILQDLIPGVKVKVLKVTAPGEVDRDLISKVIEQIMEEEDVEKDSEAKGESDQEQDDIEMDAGGVIIDSEDRSEISVKVVVGGLVQKLSSSMPTMDLLRVPAGLEKKGRLSFCFSVEKDENRRDLLGKGLVSLDKEA